MRLSELAAGDYPIAPAGADPEITGLSEDSRKIRPGMAFIAVPGSALDGHAYISDAITRGAAAIVAERTGAVPPAMPAIRVSSARAALAVLAARFYGRPAETLTTIGFTGTFGKTSTSEILRALLDAGGARTGVIGSLGVRHDGFFDSGTGLTTPAPVELHRAFRQLKGAGADTVVLEVTSHALRLDRIRGLSFDGGLMAAIVAGEHTDYHRSYDDYVAAKRLFLEHLSHHALLAYDADNHAARRLAAEAPVARLTGFSLENRDADLQIRDVLIDSRGSAFTISGSAAGAGSSERLHTPLLGRGHLRNVALALAYALPCGLPVATAASVLRGLTPLPRRMECFRLAGRVVLDDTAAHPESLKATFDVARLLPSSGMTIVYAVRGSRGTDINRRNALVLSDLASTHGADTLIVTASADRTSSGDEAQAPEIDAARQAFVERGRRFVWHDSLDSAMREALARTKVGDLLVLVGAQAMDDGKRILKGMEGDGGPARLQGF
jgi:UDP-N-acetylmuramoyl-L-alanyl-D-glutamate--2,6-diaminopimelate ligase